MSQVASNSLINLQIMTLGLLFKVVKQIHYFDEKMSINFNLLYIFTRNRVK